MKFLEKYINGELYDAYKYFGCKKVKNGYKFRVYAPNAKKVSIIGSFNDFVPQRMKKVNKLGLFEIVLDVKEYDEYKYVIDTGSEWLYKADPFAFYSENRPGTNSKVFDISNLEPIQPIGIKHDEPVVIYEMHLGSFNEKNEYTEIADDVINHCLQHGFTHIEVLPIYEHPLDESWGYQGAGYFSPTARYGSPYGLLEFVKKCHENGLGVIADWVPGHFVADSHGLSKFDGTTLFERGDHLEYTDWGTLNTDFSTGSSMSFMISSANYWVNVFGFDGIRVDAVSNLFFEKGDERYPYHAGEEFVKKLNSVVDTTIFAEDSSMYDGVTNKNRAGFDYKWSIGYMNETLEYFKKEPVHRKYHFGNLMHLMTYPFSENYVLEYSHDEVVHMKGSLLNKMPGNDFDRFANLRMMLAMMFTFPGKKLLFMGAELATLKEWDCLGQLEWELLEKNNVYNKFFKDIIQFYKSEKSLYKTDLDHTTFKVEHINYDYCTFSYSRTYEDKITIIINTLDIEVEHYVNEDGNVIFSTDDSKYGGNGIINIGDSLSGNFMLPKLSVICVRGVK